MCATSGMGAPSMSIVVNELVQVGITHDHPHRHVRLDPGPRARRRGRHRLGRADQPGRRRRHRPAASSRPSPTRSSPSPSPTRPRALGVAHHVGVMASVDTFFEGQERSASSANPHLLRRLRGMIDEYQDLGVLNFEMEAGTLFKMGAVYGFAAGCVCGIIAQRGEAEEPRHDVKDAAIDRAIRVAVAAADPWSRRRQVLTRSQGHPWPRNPGRTLAAGSADVLRGFAAISGLDFGSVPRRWGQPAVRAVTLPLSVRTRIERGLAGSTGMSSLPAAVVGRDVDAVRRAVVGHDDLDRPVVGRRHDRRRGGRELERHAAVVGVGRDGRRAQLGGLDAAVVGGQPQRSARSRAPRSSRCRCRCRRRRSSPIDVDRPVVGVRRRAPAIAGHRDLVVDAAPVRADSSGTCCAARSTSPTTSWRLAGLAQPVADLGPHLDRVAVGRRRCAPIRPSCRTSIDVRCRRPGTTRSRRAPRGRAASTTL